VRRDLLLLLTDQHREGTLGACGGPGVRTPTAHVGGVA